MKSPEKIISGGQTGADRAALDFALEHQIPHAGWCPAGRRAEDGPIHPKYDLQETPSADYAQRTEWNVRDSDGTVVFSLALELRGGSSQTIGFARRYGKPFLHLARQTAGQNPELVLDDFLRQHRIRHLNVAGPRASEEPEVAEFVREVLTRFHALEQR